MWIVLTGLNVAFPGRDLFVDAEVEIASGSSVAIMGPSGSGKSTLLAALGNLNRPRASKLTWGGIDADKRDSSTCGWILQQPAMLKRRTVWDNVMIGASAGRDSQRDRFDAASSALASVGLESFRGAPVRQLSGGEVSRTGVARALSGASPILLADEPTAQLDRKTAEIVSRSIALSSVEQGRTVVVATHDEVLANACERLLRIEEGKIVG